MKLCGSYTIFAGHGYAIYHAKTEDELQSKIHRDIKLVTNKLATLTTKKMHYIIFRTKNKPQIEFNVKVNEEVITQTEHTEYLEMVIYPEFR